MPVGRRLPRDSGEVVMVGRGWLRVVQPSYRHSTGTRSDLCNAEVRDGHMRDDRGMTDQTESTQALGTRVGGGAPAAGALDRAKVADLQLDLENPRHPDGKFDDDFDALTSLIEGADVDELVQAIGNSGWLDYEPLVVLRKGNYVLEGNRRLAALRLLRDSALQAEFGITAPDPLNLGAKPEYVRVLFVDSRAEARDFIGFKHVNGPHKWDSLAKAKFAWAWIRDPDGGLTLDQIAKRLGDSHNTVARLVNAFIVLQQAQDLGFDLGARTKTNFSFSHLYTALPRPNVREYLGLVQPPAELLPDSPVPADRGEQLLKFMTWLYGQGAQKTIIVSQNPNLNELIDVLGNTTARSMLESDRDLSLAYAQVEDRGRRFAERLYALNKAARGAAEAVSDYEYNVDLHEMAMNIQRSVRNLVTSMTLDKDAKESETE